MKIAQRVEPGAEVTERALQPVRQLAVGQGLPVDLGQLFPHGGPGAVRHLIVAGRATGGDRIAHAATRNMSCCAVTGQGAGVAAAVSIRADRPLDDVDISAVQAELIRQDVRIS